MPLLPQHAEAEIPCPLRAAPERRRSSRAQRGEREGGEEREREKSGEEREGERSGEEREETRGGTQRGRMREREKRAGGEEGEAANALNGHPESLGVGGVLDLEDAYYGVVPHALRTSILLGRVAY